MLKNLGLAFMVSKSNASELTLHPCSLQVRDAHPYLYEQFACSSMLGLSSSIPALFCRLSSFPGEKVGFGPSRCRVHLPTSKHIYTDDYAQ